MVVSGPLPTGHVTQRMHNGHFSPENALQWERYRVNYP